MDSYQAEQIANSALGIECQLRDLNTQVKEFSYQQRFANPLAALARQEWARRAYLDKGDEAKAQRMERMMQRYVECLKRVHHLMPELFGGRNQVEADQ